MSRIELQRQYYASLERNIKAKELKSNLIEFRTVNIEKPKTAVKKVEGEKKKPVKNTKKVLQKETPKVQNNQLKMKIFIRDSYLSMLDDVAKGKPVSKAFIDMKKKIVRKQKQMEKPRSQTLKKSSPSKKTAKELDNMVRNMKDREVNSIKVKETDKERER